MERLHDVFIVSSCAPTSAHSEAEWKAYYDGLSAALARRPPNAIAIIGADTNASIGRGNLISDNDNDIESLNVVGSFGIERINDAGIRRLRVFIETHQIAALSTFFNKKYYFSWTHPVSKCSYQIDHVFTFREDMRHFSDAGSVSGQLIDSDHWAVKATLRSLVAPKKMKVLKNDRQRLMRLLDYAILQSEEGRDELARRALEILKSKSDDKTSYEAIADALHLATEEILPKRARAEPL